MNEINSSYIIIALLVFIILQIIFGMNGFEKLLKQNMEHLEEIANKINDTNDYLARIENDLK